MLLAAAIAALLPSCTAESGVSEDRDGHYSVATVLFVSPDSLELHQLQARLRDDFGVVADDAMWYRSLARESADSLQFVQAETDADSARFLINGEPQVVTWSDRQPGWFAVVYDGVNRPVIVADVDIRSALQERSARE